MSGGIVATAEVIVPTVQLAICRHEPDNRFLECAEAARAEFLITGNTRHFPKQHHTTRILNAREFLEWLRKPNPVM